MFTPVPTNWASSSCEMHWNTCREGGEVEEKFSEKREGGEVE